MAEKVRYVREHTVADEHVLIVPGAEDAVVRQDRSRVYTIASPLISKTSRYRALLRLEAIERILETERPDLIESGDPYQVAWKAVYSGEALGIPVVGFYHSHFPEAYVRSARKFLGTTATELVLDIARRYVDNLYNHFARTIVPSPALGAVLTEWGVRNVVHSDLGVDAAVFHPDPAADGDVRAEFGVAPGATLLLYVGRLAQEKNTHTLMEAFRIIAAAMPGRFHLLVVGAGTQSPEMAALRDEFSAAGASAVSWLTYCAEPERIAQLYRAADLFVHPGVQETFGLVVLEAQACGTPVIGIRGSYMDRIIYCGQVHWAAENSAKSLAGAILAMAQDHRPRDAGKLHRTIATRYSWTQVFGRLFDLYRSVIEEFAAARSPHVQRETI